MQRESVIPVRHVARAGRLAVVVAVCVIVHAMARPSMTAAVDGEITSEGPLTRIIVTPSLNCQVAHQADVSLEFFGGDIGACGTFLAVGGTLFGPASIPAAGGLGNVA